MWNGFSVHITSNAPYKKWLCICLLFFKNFLYICSLAWRLSCMAKWKYFTNMLHDLLIMLFISFSFLCLHVQLKSHRAFLLRHAHNVTLKKRFAKCLHESIALFDFFLLCDGVKAYTKELVILSYFAYLGFQVGKSYVSSPFCPFGFLVGFCRKSRWFHLLSWLKIFFCSSALTDSPQPHLNVLA